jgi:hypothetical protein
VATGGGWVDRLKRKKMEEEERVAKEKKKERDRGKRGGERGSRNRWEPVRFGRFPVESVRPGT